MVKLTVILLQIILVASTALAKDEGKGIILKYINIVMSTLCD